MVVIRRGFNNPNKPPEKPLNEMSDKEKTEKIYECLDRLHEENWSLKNWITIREVRCGTGYRYQNQRSFDYMAICTLEGNSVRGYEVKASRADFLKDVKDPEKQKALRCFCNLFYYVAPEGIIKKEELPPWAGLIELNYDGEKYWLNQAVGAPLQANFPPTWSFVAECIRNKNEQHTREIRKENKKLAEDILRLEGELKEARLQLLLLGGKNKNAEH